MADKKTNYEKVVKNFLYFFAIPLLLFVLFKKAIDVIVTTLIVKPLFSFCSPASWIYDITVISFFGILFLPIFLKMGNATKISIKWTYASIVYSIMYLNYRLGSLFSFTPFSFNNLIKLSDLISVIPITICGLTIFYSKKKKILTERNEYCIDKNKGFLVDEPRDESEVLDMVINDTYKRYIFVKVLSEKIQNTKPKKGSFTIGISAPWGAGKTTFLNNLSKEFNNKHWIKINFNVWRCASSSQITDTFFKLLRENLEPYSFSINNKLKDYSNSLLKSSKSDLLDTVKNLADLISPVRSLEEQYEIINSEINEIGDKLGKRILIFIDDLDRLDKKEIYEVIRLIRNTANFSHIFFIVAYDRNYILNAIEEINTYKAHFFLEKIFQLEFVLPPIEKIVLQNEINNKLDFLTKESQDDYYEMLDVKGVFSYQKKIELTYLFVDNIRDVKRFINSLKLNYEFVKHDIYFPDYYNLELIRFKHPEIFADVYRNKDQLIISDKSKNSKSDLINTLMTVKKENSTDSKTVAKNDDELFEIEKYLFKRKSIYKLSDLEIRPLVDAYRSIFTDRNKYAQNSHLSKSHLSVIFPSMFERYFVLNIDGKLSEKDFSKWRQMPSDDFNAQIKIHCEDGKLVKDIYERLENITNFDNAEDFEKIVKAIFYFANLPNPANTHYPKFINYDRVVICDLLNNKRTIGLLYDDKEKVTQLISSLIETNSAEYGFANQFIRHIPNNNKYDLSDYLTNEKIYKIIFQNFKNALSKSNKFSWFLWYFFEDCLKNLENPFDNENDFNKSAIILMKDFIETHDINGFISHSIVQNSNNKNFIISDSVKKVYKSNANFINFLNESVQPIEYREEFIFLNESLTTNEKYNKEGVPFSFFKIISVCTTF